MSFLLQWRLPDPAIVARWRGPDERLAPSALAVPVTAIPTLIGPPGVAGPQGPQGPVADLIDCGVFG
jgi:hypothetical protein